MGSSGGNKATAGGKGGPWTTKKDLRQGGVALKTEWAYIYRMIQNAIVNRPNTFWSFL
jgi:hypothetical protein